MSSGQPLPTWHDRMMRGQTKTIERFVRDSKQALVDLTDACIFYTLFADLKVAATLKLTSNVNKKAFLPLYTLGDALLDTVVQAKSSGVAGETITITLTADGAGSGSRSEVGTAITLHYQAGVTTVANIETLINASSQVEVRRSGTVATVLDAGTAFAATALRNGIDNTFETNILIDPDQNSNRGRYVITIVPSDTSGLVVGGDGDPWLHEARVIMPDGSSVPDFAVSKMAIFAQGVVVS